MKFRTFMNSLLTNVIAPKSSKLAKISSLNFMFKKPYLSQYLMDSNKEGWIPIKKGSKFKLDCIQSINSSILLIDIVTFKLRNFTE